MGVVELARLRIVDHQEPIDKAVVPLGYRGIIGASVVIIQCQQEI